MSRLTGPGRSLAGAARSPVRGRSLPVRDPQPLEPLRYQRPDPPRMADIARYYALSEEAHWYSNMGPCHERLADRLGTYAGGAHAVPVGNCTLGLMAALRAVCGEPKAHRRLIAVPSFSFTATACAIRWAGFQPLFVDVDAESWQLDPDALDSALATHPGLVAGVLGCSTFGSAAPEAVRHGWRSVAGAAGVPLLIDSAAGFGALTESGERLGGLGDTEVFSFHATKPFSIGEGGAVLTGDANLAERLRRLINFGIDGPSRTSAVPGLNAKLSELMAAAALAMLDRYDEVLSSRRSTAARLQRRLERYPLTYQSGSDGSTWQVFQLLLPDFAARRRALALCEDLAIEARTCFDPPLHRHPAFADAPVAGSLSVTEGLASRALSLPMANTLGPRQVARVSALLERTFSAG